MSDHYYSYSAFVDTTEFGVDFGEPKELEVPAGVTFTPMAFSGMSTVAAAAPAAAERPTSYQSEAQLEEAFIEQLCAQGYTRLRINSEEELIHNLRRQLERLNNLEFSDGEWERFFTTCLASKNEGIEEKTRRIQEDHVQSLRRDDGFTKNIRLLDKDNIHNNRLQVMNQYEVEGVRKNRYDVTVLVNGLPLVHVELKRRGVPIREAFNQINRYQRESFWAGSGLFNYVQIFVISNGTHTKYYSNTTRDGHVRKSSGAGAGKKTSDSFEFTNWWAAADNTPIKDLVPFTSTFFAKHTLLALLTRYCVFTEDRRLLAMRPYQIVACESILERVKVATMNPKRLGSVDAGGYIWHSTGSGKTLTSFKTARLASEMEGVDKVLFVVDRKDLDYQTQREYDKFERGAVDGSASTAVLARNLADPGKRILVTTIQKLASFIRQNQRHAVYAKNVVIIFDECHRSQFGEMHLAITRHFRRYCLFGFTGTPIFAANAPHSARANFRTTEQAFGKQLHRYTIVDAIRDGNVLPFRVDYIQTFRPREDFPDDEVYNIHRQAAFLDARRISQVVEYVLDHYAQKTKASHSYKLGSRRVKGFNSLFAVSSIPAAKLYYREFARQQAERPGMPLKVATIFSFAPNEESEGCFLPDETFDVEGLDQPSRDFLEEAIRDYNRMFGTSFSTAGGDDGFAGYYAHVAERMKKRELDLLIVVGMFLTGFDATTLNTLWVDKDMRDHGLLQAFSRTNRILNSVKDFGNVVCFRNLEDQVNAAISLFGDAEAGGVVLLRPYQEYLDAYCAKVERLFAEFPLSTEIVGEEAERAFVKLFGEVLRLRNVLQCFDEFASDETLSERDEQDYRSWYADLYDKYRARRPDPTLINDDLEFEVELLKTVDIDIDYILELVRKYHDGNVRDAEVLAKIERALRSTPELRPKRELIMSFVESVNSSETVGEEWRVYVAAARKAELEALVAAENLDPERTAEFVARAFEEGAVSEVGTGIAGLLRAAPSRFAPAGEYDEKVARVLERLRAYFTKFSGL